MAREMVLNALVVFLLAVILFMCWLHACGRWRQWRSAEETGENVAEDDQPLKAVQRKGLDKAMIDALPTFIYSSNDEKLQGSADDEGDERSGATSPTFIYSSNDQFQILQGSEDEKGWAACSRKSCGNIIVECPVCLCEFQHMEKGRVLPNCRHRFHVDCIDTWLLSSATCPVCRASCADQSAAAAARTAEDGVPLLQVITSSPGGARNGEMSSSAQGNYIQYPTNVLFWGSDSLVSSRNLSTQAHAPATAASTIIQIHTQVLQPLHAAAPSLSLSSPASSPSSRIIRLNSLRRLLTRDQRQLHDPGFIGASSKA